MVKPIAIRVCNVDTGATNDYTFDTSPVRIGRNPLNDLCLPYPFVSGWHAVVRFDGEGARFFDLGSTNGTLIRGTRIEAGAPVEIDGDVTVTIGRVEVRFSRGSEARVPAYRQAERSGSVPMQVESGAVAVGTAHVPMAAIHHSAARLQDLFQAYRSAWGRLRDEIQQTIVAMEPSAQALALAIYQREFPGIEAEPEFSQWLAQAGIHQRAPTNMPVRPSSGGNDLQLVGELSQALRPAEPPPRDAHEARGFLRCVADVMRASAKAFIELQKGQEQFGVEMGVRTIKEFTPLHAANTAENLLGYLLDWRSGGPARTKELVGVYADLMIHQVALINGVVEGARGLLAKLDPGAIERAVTTPWPARGAALWKRFGQRYHELLTEDRQLTAAIFGPEFARAYAEVGGEGAGTPS